MHHNKQILLHTTQLKTINQIMSQNITELLAAVAHCVPWFVPPVASLPFPAAVLWPPVAWPGPGPAVPLSVVAYLAFAPV